MSIQLVTDSTCDLPDTLVQQLGIHIVPLYVNMDGNSYLDGYDLTREEFYDRIEHSRPHPTTAAPGIEAFKLIYQRLFDAGTEGILSIHVAKSLSNTCGTAELAAQELGDRYPIAVVDSQQLSLGLGLLVLKGAELASSGASLEDTAARVREVAKRTVSYAWLNTLEYLRRSGRLSFMKNSLASMLDIKPIMKMEEGSARMESVRTKKRAVARVLELVQDLGPIENIGITHFSAAEDVASIQPYLRSFLPQTMPILENYVTPTLGAHVGPGAVCISCIAEHPLDRIRLSKMERLKKAIRTITG